MLKMIRKGSWGNFIKICKNVFIIATIFVARYIMLKLEQNTQMLVNSAATGNKLYLWLPSVNKIRWPVRWWHDPFLQYGVALLEAQCSHIPQGTLYLVLSLISPSLLIKNRRYSILHFSLPPAWAFPTGCSPSRQTCYSISSSHRIKLQENTSPPWAVVWISALVWSFPLVARNTCFTVL